MLPVLILAVLLLSNSDKSAAFLVTARPSTTTLVPRKRDALVTRFFSIFYSGDPSQVRVAQTGFDCRVDLDHSLWGFCPTSVIVASDCGLAGNCVDRHSCSKGCGKGAGYTTFTCTGSDGEFCTTAELYLANNIGPFSYIGCGGEPTTDRYSAFTTDPATSISSAITTRLTSTSLAPTSSSQPTQTAYQITTTKATSTTPAAPATGVAYESGNASSNNTGAIIGGVVGCLALVCGSGIAVVWLLKRRRHRSNSKSPSVQEDVQLPPDPAPRSHNVDVDMKVKYPAAGWGPRGLDDPHLVQVQFPGELRAMKSPVELPAAPPYHQGGDSLPEMLSHTYSGRQRWS